MGFVVIFSRWKIPSLQNSGEHIHKVIVHYTVNARMQLINNLEYLQTNG